METLLVLVLGCIGLYWWKHQSFFLLAGFGIGLSGLLIPVVGNGIHQGWGKLSEGLGWVMGKVLLTAIYFLLLAPLAFFARWMGKIGVRLKPGGDSYFKDRDHVYKRDDLVNPW